MNFDWRTDDEESWTPQTEPPLRPSPNRWRRLLVGLVALAVALLGVAYLYRQAQQRIAATEEAVTDDVLASHELVTTAARTGDPEMLRNVLSGADDDWAAAQLSRVGNYPDAGRETFGLRLLEEEGPPPEVALNPEMRAAELIWVARYTVANPSGVVSTVALTQTAVYRRGSDNWLLAPPEPAFWQGSDEYRGEYLEAIYPGRDEAIAARLAAGLDGVLGELCQTSCPAGYRLRLILSPDPASFDNTAPRALLSAGRTLVLPAPTLVGLPVDDGAYEALERGYAVLVTTAVLADAAAYDCCEHARYAAAWVHLQQARLGLRLWPLDPAAYERLLLQLPPADELLGLLGRRPADLGDLPFDELAPVYAFAEFLQEAYGPAWATAALHGDRVMRESGLDRESWAGAFPRFVYEHSRSGQLPAPPAPLPEANLALQCSREGVQVELRQLDLQDGATRSLYENADIAGLNWPDYSWTEPFGAGKGLLLISRQRLAEGDGAGRFEFSMRLLKDGVSQTVYRTLSATWEELPDLAPQGADPAGRTLVLADYSRGRGTSPTRGRYLLADLERCDGAGCALHEIPGNIRWSPAGTYTLVAGNAPPANDGRNVGLQLYEGDGGAQNLRPVGWAGGATWLDDAHYAYAALPPEEPELVVRAVGEEAELLRFSLADLWELAGAGEERPLNATVLDYDLVAQPQDPTRLLLKAGLGAYGTQGPGTLLLVQLAPDLRAVETSTALAADAAGYAFSATGRWAGLYRHRTAAGEQPYTLYDLEGAEVTAPAVTIPDTRSTPGWAPEGDWLAIRGESYLLLYNPGADYTHFVPIGDGCYAYDWVAER